MAHGRFEKLMPVCTWCGIESKNDLVCDWCKRPLALRSQRKADGRSSVDLLRDGDEDTSPLMPKVIAASAVVVLLAIIGVIWMMSSRQATSSPNQMPTEYTASRDPAYPTNQAAIHLPEAQPVFLPQPTTPVPLPRRDYSSNPSKDYVPTATAAPNDQSKLHVVLFDDPKEFGSPSVRLSAGLIRATSGRRAIGKVSVMNTTEGRVVDFRLEADISGGTYELRPFEGSIDRSHYLTDRTIDKGQKLTVPVLVIGYQAGKKGSIVPARIRLQAWLDAGRPIQEDEMIVP